MNNIPGFGAGIQSRKESHKSVIRPSMAMAQEQQRHGGSTRNLMN